MNVRIFAASSVLLICAACASTSPGRLTRYQPPPPGVPVAALINRGMSGRVSLIDGNETAPLSRRMLVSPGVHRIGIDCLFQVRLVNTSIKHAALTGPFVANREYHVRCSIENGEPRAWIAESPDGLSLPEGFEEAGV